jgi:hypothetical protein
VTDVNPVLRCAPYGRSMNTNTTHLKTERLRKGAADALTAALPLAMLACFGAWIAGVAGVGA